MLYIFSSAIQTERFYLSQPEELTQYLVWMIHQRKGLHALVSAVQVSLFLSQGWVTAESIGAGS